MLSFFGDQAGKSANSNSAFLSKARRPPPKPTGGPGSGGSSGSVSTSARGSNGLLKVPSPAAGISSPSATASKSLSRPSVSNLKAASSSTSRTIGSSGGKARSTPPPSKARPSSRSPLPSTSKIKRKVIERIQSESESDSLGSDSSSSEDVPTTKPKMKRQRTKNSTGTGTGTATPFPGEEEMGRDIFCLDQVDQRGEYGRGWVGFVGSEEVVKGQVKGWGGGSIEGNAKWLDKYQAYFPQPGFEAAEPLPSVELLFPAVGCREKFILLTPTSPREYSPISELRTSLRLILDHYIPPSHQHIFGTLSDSLGDALESLPPVASRVMSPLPSSLATPPPDPSSSPAPTPAPITAETIGDALRKALAPNRRDGPGLLRAMERYNCAMEELQKDGAMHAWLKARARSMKAREWSHLVDVIHEHAYSRVVGPYSHELEHHPKHPDEVAKAISAKEDAYGELRHNFMSKVIEQTNLGPDSVFVDLGSGVGNCVVQAALQAGARSTGFELLPVPSRCARLQIREAQRRWAMWGLKGNLEVEVYEGDFRTHPLVAKRLREADVVLVNNEVFPSSLNIDLGHIFFDLKEGAKIVSLKPFVAEGFRMNESNCDTFSAIIRSTQHTYYQDWVSWKGDSGKYYVQTIDRSMRAKFEEEMSGRARRR